MKKFTFLLPVIVILAGCSFQFNGMNPDNKIQVDEIESINKEPGMDVYQFLSDTKDVYCEYIEGGIYFQKVHDEVINGKKGTEDEWVRWYREWGKASFLKFEMIGLSSDLEMYLSKYSEFPFKKSINLLRAAIEYRITQLQSLTNIEKLHDSYYEDAIVYSKSSKEALSSFRETLLEEYKAIRGEDETQRPTNEAELLDLSSLCPIDSGDNKE